MIESPSSVTTELSESVAFIRFNRPIERNPLSIATLDQLRTAFRTLTDREDVEAIIFTGADHVFASGANIRELAKLNAESANDFAIFGQDLFQSIAQARQVTIAAINGYWLSRRRCGSCSRLCTGGRAQLAQEKGAEPMSGAWC